LNDANESAVIKLTMTRSPNEAAERALAMMGNPGLSPTTRSNGTIARYFASPIHSPHSDTILVAAGRAALAAIAQESKL
jgi:hypothetical protein